MFPAPPFSPPDLPPESAARRVTFFVFLTVFLDLIGFGIVFPFLPLYVQNMGGTATTVGFLFACFSFTQLLATPLLGRLSDRIGRRPVMILSLAGNAASMVVFAIATERAMLPLLFVSRTIAGATAGNLAACQAAVADVTPESGRAQAMGRVAAGIGLGMVLGPVAGGTLATLSPWAPPLAAAGLALADLIGAFLFMPETRHLRSAPASAGQRPAVSSEKRRGVLLQAPIPILLALSFLFMASMTNLQVALALLTHARFGWGEKEVGYVFAIFGSCMLVIQGLLIGSLVRTFGERRLVFFAALLMGSGMAIICAAGDTAVLILGLTMVGIGLGVANPLLSTLASASAPPDSRGIVLGFVQSAGGLARTLGPVVGGYLFVHVGAGAPFGVAAAMGLLAAGLTLELMRVRAPAPS